MKEIDKNKMDLKNISSEDLRNELELRGYYTENLWHVDDVFQKYYCEPEEAQEILDSSLTNEWITEQIFTTINEISNDYKLKL